METESRTIMQPYHLEPPAVERGPDGVWRVHGYPEARSVLMGDVLQAGFKSEEAARIPGMRVKPVLWQDGEEHRTQRSQIARFFSPSTVQQKYLPMIERYADQILGEFARTRRADLHDLTAKMAMSVAAEIVGLTNSSQKGLYNRLDRALHSDPVPGRSPRSLMKNLAIQNNMLLFWWLDVRPAIEARKKEPREDVISYMLANNRTPTEIIAECITYGAAGMVTTQEFISIAAWHFLERSDLRERFLEAGQEERYQILREILRLEPVVGKLYRRAASDLQIESRGETFTIPAGSLIEISTYDVNADERVVGEEPLSICPEREIEKKVTQSVMAFGAGPHRCAGEYIAITESDVFLRKLLAMPGLKIEQQPEVGYFETAKGYEVHNFRVRLD